MTPWRFLRSAVVCLSLSWLAGCGNDPGERKAAPSDKPTKMPAGLKLPEKDKPESSADKLSPPARRREAEEKVVAFVEKLGGKVTRFDGSVIVVDLEKTPVQDSELKELAALTKLSYLDLREATRVTDAGLKELAPLKSLTWLFLSGTKVTDEGLKELAPLKNLAQLSLNDTKVTDAGLKYLANLAKLKQLNLFGTRVTDAGLRACLRSRFSQ